MSGQETVRVYSYNPGAHTGLGPGSSHGQITWLRKILNIEEKQQLSHKSTSSNSFCAL